MTPSTANNNDSTPKKTATIKSPMLMNLMNGKPLARKNKKRKQKKSTKAPTGVTEENKPVIDLEKEEKKKSAKTSKKPQQVNELKERVLELQLTNLVEHSSTTTTTLLIGDSMIKNVQGWHLGKAVGHKVFVKPFPGASTRAMKDYMKVY